MLLRIKSTTLAILLLAGISGLSAQNYRGNQYLRNQRGGCVATATLSETQQAEVASLSKTHQAEMDALRTDLRASGSLDERQAIRAKMDASQATHRTKIVELGAQPANVPHAGYYNRGAGQGLGRGAAVGLGRGAGAGYGRGAAVGVGYGRGAGVGYGRGAGVGAGYGRAAGGRGLGPCGAGYGPRR